MKKRKKKKISTEKTVIKTIQEKENIQLKWIFGVIIFAFLLFLGTYFYLGKIKQFEYAGINWVIEDHGDLKFYHGKFLAFNNKKLTYNIYLRNDPRENNIDAEGDFSFIKRTTFLSFSPEVDKCREDIPVAVVNLGAFLMSGVGVENLEPATTEPQVYYDTGRTFADCDTIDGGIIIIEKGESSVTQSQKNPFCYTIKIENCEDIKPIEKFIIKVIQMYYGEK
jgi:hypothetical protein